MPYTVEEAKQYVANNRADITLGMMQLESTQAWRQNESFLRCWDSGCWLSVVLRKMKATDAQVHDITFAHGQRSLFGDAYAWAVAYANEFEKTGNIPEAPGRALAARINKQHLKVAPAYAG